MIKYTDYALKRMLRRNISEEQVATVLANPGQTVDVGRRRVAQSRLMASGTEHLLRVVYEDQNGDKLVITVYETSKIAKYWRAT